MKSKYLITIFISIPVFILISCSSHKRFADYDGNVIDIPVSFTKEYTDIFHLSYMVDTTFLIPLDSTIKWGYISTIKYRHGNYYLLDSSNQSIYVVDSLGKVLHNVNHRGRAKSEYVSLTAYDVNPISGELVIYDENGDKVITYTKEGVYKSSYFLDTSCEIYRDIAVQGNGDIVCCAYDYNGPNARRGVWLADSTGHFKKQLIEVNDNHRFYVHTTTPLLSRMDDSTLVIAGPIGDDNIYHIHSDGSVSTKYHLTYDKVVNEATLKKEATTSLVNEVYIRHCCMENLDWLIVQTGYENSYTTLFYDKKTGVPYISNRNTTIDLEGLEYFGVAGCSYHRGCDVSYPDNDINSNPVLIVYITK